MGKIRTGDIVVEGLGDLAKALREMDTELAKDLRGANKDAATIAARAGRSRAVMIGGVAAKVAPSIRASAGAKSASVGFGGARFPFAGGAEFGAGHDRPRTRKSGSYRGYNQFPTFRGSGRSAGYFIYPSIRDHENEIAAEYMQALDDLLLRTGWTT